MVDSPLEAGLLGEPVSDLPARSADKIESRLLKASTGMQQALGSISDACTAFGIPRHLAALRWLFHHSALEPGDSIILGCATLQQLCSNLDALDYKSDPLPEDLACSIDMAWSEWKRQGPANELGQTGMKHMFVAKL